MKKFIQINRNVSQQGFGKFLSYLLVKKSLELIIEDPSIIAEHLIVEFN
jgi:hypothetical protein